MKKSLIFVGMLSIGYAYAQEGNVGINTDQPKATLDIQPNATNLAGTTNEGILAPRLSKTRVANIETPVQGTLVYVLDENSTEYPNSLISAYTGNDSKVSKITEKGYYFYNGTEWVKVQHTDTNTSIWTKQNDNSILLADNDIENTVSYSSTGAYINIPKTLRQISKFENNSIITGEYKPNETNNGNSGHLNIFYADKIKENFLDPLYKEKALNFNHLVIDDRSRSSQIDRYFGQKNLVQANETSTRNYASLYANVNGAEHYGTGRVSLLMGAYNFGATYKGAATRIVGAYNQATTNTASDVGMMEGTYSFITPRGSGKITDIFATRNYIDLNAISSNAITNATGTHNHLRIAADFGGTIDNYSGTYTFFEVPATYTGVKNVYGTRIANAVIGQESNYGLWIGNVGNTTATKNYAIYTHKGMSSVGDTFEVRSDNWQANQEAILQFKNGSRKEVATSQIIDKMNGVGDGGSNLIFTTQSPTLGTNPNTTAPTEKMRIGANGKITIADLADTSATADRTVVVDKNGVLKIGTSTASTGATTLTGEENLECNATNRGKMNFVKDDAGFDVFGICMKGTNGYSWRYIYGNGGVSTGTGAFGSGLQ